MARKIIDIQPIITARFVGGGLVTGQDAAFAQIEDTIAQLAPDFECEVSYETDARCEHCNAIWTEAGSDYNGGCCVSDFANDPERLGSLRRMASEVCGTDLYRVDVEGGRARVTCDWPWAMAHAAIAWLEAGRPAKGATALLPLIERVDSSEWCTVWEDPGVYASNAGAGPLSDQVSTATEPNELASDLRRLLDDMGLTAERRAA